MRARESFLMFLSIASVLLGTPLIPKVHAASWTLNPNYSSTCMLGHYAQSSGSTGLSGYAFYNSGASCNGVGYLKTEAYTSVGGSSSANANVTFVDSQSFNVPNDGQIYTQLGISATYFVIANLKAAGGGAGVFDHRSQVQVELSLMVNGIEWDNTTYTDRGWGVECSDTGITLDKSLTIATCPIGSTNLPIKSQFAATTGYRLYPGNSYALRLSFIESSNSWTAGLAQGYSMACLMDDSTQPSPNYDCSVQDGGTSTTQCPSGTFSNPCYYVQWQYATYTFSDVFSGPPDFSVVPQSVVTPSLDGSAAAACGSGSNGCSPLSVSLTTTTPYDIIIVDAGVGDGATCSCSIGTPTDTSSLTWTARKTLFGQIPIPGQYEGAGEWYAKSPGVLSGDTITVTFSIPSGTFPGESVIAFGIAGANFNNPFDSGGPGYGIGASASPSAAITTYGAGIVFGFVRSYATYNTVSLGAGFTSIQLNPPVCCGAADPIGAEYQVTGPVTNLTVPFSLAGGGNGWLEIVDAIDVYTPLQTPVYQNGLSWWDPVTIKSINGFSGPVSLSTSISTSGSMTPPSVSISPGAVTIPTTPPPSATATLYASATTSTTPGAYTLAITASGGGIVHKLYVPVIVALVDPTVTLSISQSAVYQGVKKVITLNVTEGNSGNMLDGFEPVYFLANGNQVGSWYPVTCTPPPFPFCLPNYLVLYPGQSVTGTISWNVTSLPVGIYNITAYVQVIPGEYLATNSMTKRLDIDPAGVDLSVSASSNTVYIPQGKTGRLQVTLSPVNSFTGGVSATGSMSSAGLSWDFAPFPVINVHPFAYVNGTTTSATLVVNATSTATLGSHAINVAISSDLPLSHTITVNVFVYSFGILSASRGFGYSGVSIAANPLQMNVTIFNPSGLTETNVPVNATAKVALRTDSKIMFVDANSNGHWDPGETVVYDTDGNKMYDATDTVISGTVPANGTPLSSDVNIMFVDLRYNGIWSGPALSGDPVVYETDGNGLYDTGETIIAGTVSPGFLIWSTTIPTLAPGANVTVTFYWDPVNLPRGNFMLAAMEGVSPGQVAGLVPFTQRLKGDVNGDCVVNIADLATVGSNFGKTRGDTGFNAAADLNNDGVINITDLVLVAGGFGRHC